MPEPAASTVKAPGAIAAQLDPRLGAAVATIPVSRRIRLLSRLMLFLTPILIIVFVPLSLWIAIVEPSLAWMWLLVAALLVLVSGPIWFFLLRLMRKRGIVIAENGLWHDSGLIRLRTVFWSEVGQLERHGKTLRIKLADLEAFNAARPGVHLLGDAPYAPLALNAYVLPPDEVLRLIERELEAWRARQA
jgi:hypothetical protein